MLYYIELENDLASVLIRNLGDLFGGFFFFKKKYINIDGQDLKI